jgi:hypothetical protein
MLGWFVNIFLEENWMVPEYILVLFIVATLAAAWAVFSLFAYHRSKRHAQFVALIDLAFVGALIAGVYYMRFITGVNCSNIQRGSNVDRKFGVLGSVSFNTWNITFDKTCSMLKASFAFGIINILNFFWTALLACIFGDRHAKKEERRYYEERPRSRRRSNSGHHSRRSSHSHSRAYV